MWYVKALVVVVVLTAMGMGYNHYNNVLHDLATAQQVIVTKTLENGELKESRDVWKSQAEALSMAMVGMADNSAEVEREVERLRDVQRDHDLEALAEGKPGLIERRINDGTSRVFRMFEEVTGDGSGGDG